MRLNGWRKPRALKNFGRLSIDSQAAAIWITAFRDSIGLQLSAFDAKWRKSLAQRYHWAAMLSSSHLFWGSLALFFMLVYLRYWRYKRKRLRQMESESEEVDAFFIER